MTMTCLEVVGALASVSQLTSYVVQITISLSNLYVKLLKAPRIFQQYVSTVRQLEGVIQILRCNEWLRTTIIIDSLQSLSEKIKDALSLLPLPEQVVAKTMSKLSFWLRRAMQYLRNEEELRSVFAALADMKSTLALCILNTQVQHAGKSSRNTAKCLEMLPMIGSLQQDVSYLRHLVESSKVCTSYIPFHLSTAELCHRYSFPLSPSWPMTQTPSLW